jgi:hypothetical protein
MMIWFHLISIQSKVWIWKSLISLIWIQNLESIQKLNPTTHFPFWPVFPCSPIRFPLFPLFLFSHRPTSPFGTSGLAGPLSSSTTSVEAITTAICSLRRRHRVPPTHLFAPPSGEEQPNGARSPAHLDLFLFISPSSPFDNRRLQFAPPVIVAHPLSSLSSPIKGASTLPLLHSFQIRALFPVSMPRAPPRWGQEVTTFQAHRRPNPKPTPLIFARGEVPLCFLPLYVPLRWETTSQSGRSAQLRWAAPSSGVPGPR